MDQIPDICIFASAFDDVPQALSLFIDGRTVRSNAALQYRSKTGCSIAQAVKTMCEIGDQAAWAENWTAEESGMIRTRIKKEWILQQAEKCGRPSADNLLLNRAELFFEEKSQLMRLAMTQEDPGMIQETSLDLFCRAMACKTPKEAAKVLRLISAELDKRQMMNEKADPVMLAAAGILEEIILKEEN